MTRKDFELIAKTIKEMTLTDDERLLVAQSFGIALANTNSRFDWERFIDACGVPTRKVQR